MGPSSHWLRAVALAFAFGCAACGYHVAGRGERLPPDVKTVAIPTFTNQSRQFRIEQTLTSAVTREFIERTRFQVTPDLAGADAVLRGTIKDVESGVITFDVATGRASALQVVVAASVSLTDLHTHKVLFSNPGYVFREEYQISSSSSQLFQEEGPALKRLASDFAHTLVTDILENF